MQNYLSKKVKEQRIAQALLCATVFGIGVGATPHLVKGDNGYSIVMGNEAKAEEVIDLNIKQIAAGDKHTVFIKNDGTIWAIGDNRYGQLGLGDTSSRNVPTKVNIDNVKQVIAGVSHTFFIKNDGSVWATGANLYGDLGLGDTTGRNVPTKVNIDNVKEIIVGYGCTIFIKNDGSVWATGANSYGQLGLGDKTNRNVPTKVNIDNVKEVIAEGNNTIFIKNDGTIWGSGDNSSGQFGFGDWGSGTERTVPTKINIDNVKNVFIGCGNNVFFVKNDESVWGVGNNAGQLGVGDMFMKPVPTKIDINNVKEIVTGNYYTVFLKNDGTVFATGSNELGGPGLGFYDKVFLPTKIDIDSVKKVIVEFNHTFFIKNDGTVWVTGFNNCGEFGLGDNSNRRNPTKINIDNVREVVTGESHTMFIKNDGTVWGTGSNSQGELGLGDWTNRNIPTQLTGTGDFFVPSDTEVPNGTISADKTTWTNADVTLTIAATDNIGVKSITTPDGKVVTGANTTFIADKNGKYSFTIEDTAGNKKVVEYTVSNIDKAVPTLTVTPNTTAPTSGNVTLTIASSSASGIKETKVNGTVVSGNTYSATANGKYTVEVTDNAGNKTTKEITVSNIDKELPNATVTADKTNWTNSDVILTVNATDNVGIKSITPMGAKIIAGSNNTFAVSINWNVCFIIEDTAGNKKTVDYIVSNIDKTAPIVEIAIKDSKVIVEANDSESGIAKKYFKLDNGEWVETMPDLTGLYGKHTLQAKATDLAGNVSEIASLGFCFYTSEDDVSKEYAEKLANATTAVVKAEGSKLQADVDTARNLVNSLNDTDKAPLGSRLDAVQKAINDAKTYAEKLANATTAVVKAEGSKLQADVDSARTLVSGLNDSDKTSLNARLDVVQKAIDVQTILDELDKLADKIKDGTANQSDLDKIKDLVDELPKSEEKDDLQKQIDDAQKAIDEAKAEVDKKAKEDAATKLVEKAEQTKNQKDLDKAKNAVNELEDSSIKTELTDKINEIQKAIDAIKADKELQQKALADATALVEKAEQSKTRADYDIAVSAVKALPVMPGKVELQRRLDKLNVEMLKEESNARQQEYENMKAAESAVRKASITKDEADIAKAQELINKLKDGPNKDRLQNWLDSFAPKDDNKLTSGDIYNLQKDAEKALKKAEVYRTQTDIDVAQEAIDKIPDRISTKAIYQARLDKVTVKDGTGSSSNNTYANVLALRNAEKVLKKAELNHSAEDLKIAEELVNALVPSDKKELFVLRVNAEKLMQKAETEPSQENLDAVRESIEELPYGMVKYQLLRRISVVQKSLK